MDSPCGGQAHYREARALSPRCGLRSCSAPTPSDQVSRAGGHIATLTSVPIAHPRKRPAARVRAPRRAATEREIARRKLAVTRMMIRDAEIPAADAGVVAQIAQDSGRRWINRPWASALATLYFLWILVRDLVFTHSGSGRWIGAGGATLFVLLSAWGLWRKTRIRRWLRAHPSGRNDGE
jgi:hypothetical protein